jgi:hypothetical protein
MSMEPDSRRPVLGGFWRWLPVLAVSTLLILIYGGSAVRGDSPAIWWKAWGVPAMEPVFFDASVIGTWFDLRRAGLDPSTENPLDPLKRTLNYPPTIFVFSLLGWSQATTPIVGVLFAILYVGCIAVLTSGVSRWGALFWTLLACAPAGLLAVERGNMDILILALVVLSMRLSHRPWGAAAFLVLAALWKLFAVAGVGALLVGTRAQRMAGVASIVICLGAFWLMRDSVFTSMGSLAHEYSTAFGTNTAANFWLHNGNPGGLAESIRFWALPMAIFLALIAVASGFLYPPGSNFRNSHAAQYPSSASFSRGFPSARKGRFCEDKVAQKMHSPQNNLESLKDTFGAWLGALLFAVLFLSGTQFDYKLLFLWPMIPWIWRKATEQNGLESMLAGLWLLCLLLASGWLFFSTDIGWRLFFLKQLLTWILFFVSAFFGGRLMKSLFG